jgi:ABC-2 type transport system ATP-binding protein
MVDKELLDYIEQSREHGVSDVATRDLLFQVGWQSEDIDAAFEAARKTVSVVEIQNLKKHFGTTKAVDDISLRINKGEIFGFLGPNGAGKTTTIRCMMDFIRPTSGKILLFGKDAQKNSVSLKNKIGYLSGNVQLYDKWTGRMHINFMRRPGGKDNASLLINRLGLDINRRAGKLSSGNRQKLGLILSLMHEPELIIFDEPTNALDPLLQNIIYELLKDLAKSGTTIFMSSHNLAEVERICTRVGVIRQGKIVVTESIADMRQKHLHTVEVFFKQNVKKEEFLDGDTEITKEFPDGVCLTVRGEIAPLLRRLAPLPVKDIDIRHSSLEDMFMEFYKK